MSSYMDSSYLDQAKAVTLQSRQAEYGHPLVNFLRTAIRWSLWLKTNVTPYDVAMMMTEMKMARQEHLHKEDNMVDAIGYISCVDRMDAFMQELGYFNGIRTFIDERDEWDVPRMFFLLRLSESRVPGMKPRQKDKDE